MPIYMNRQYLLIYLPKRLKWGLHIGVLAVSVYYHITLIKTLTKLALKTEVSQPFIVRGTLPAPLKIYILCTASQKLCSVVCFFIKAYYINWNMEYYRGTASDTRRIHLPNLEYQFCENVFLNCKQNNDVHQPECSVPIPTCRDACRYC